MKHFRFKTPIFKIRKLNTVWQLRFSTALFGTGDTTVFFGFRKTKHGINNESSVISFIFFTFALFVGNINSKDEIGNTQ